MTVFATRPSLRGFPALRDRAPQAGEIVLAGLASVVAAGVLAKSGSWEYAFGGLAGAVLLALGMLRPAAFLTLVLLVRPLLDALSEHSLGVPSLNVAGIVGIVLIGFAVVLLVTEARVASTPPMLALVVITIVTAIATVVAIQDFGGTIGLQPVAESVRVTSIVALYLLAVNLLTSADRIRTLFITVALSGVVPALMGISELVTGTVVTKEQLGIARISGPFVGPNPLGMYLAVSALVLIGLPKGWLPTSVRFLAGLPIAFALTATYSRTGWVLFLVGLLMLEWRRRKGLVVAVLVAVVGLIALVPNVQQRVLPSSDPAASETTYDSFGWRLENWRDLLEKAQQRPILGWGTKSVIYVNPRRVVGGVADANGGFEAHNTVVRVLVEGGIVLLLVYLGFAFLVLRSTWRLAHDAWDLRPLGQIVLVLWSTFFIIGLGTDDPFDLTAVVFVLIALTGALEGARRLGVGTPHPPEASPDG